MDQALQWNPEKEEFTGFNAKEANQWLSREMRKPYDYRAHPKTPGTAW
jgi:hypothetical protein